MPLQEILERNRMFVRGRSPQPLPPPELVRLVVLACYDPRLDPLLRPALGLGEQQAFIIRSAGAVVASAGDPLRSVALAVYLFNATEVIVVGHTSCRMAAFETPRFIEAFRGRGVPREAFGAEDLRGWAGAIHDPKRGVMSSVATLRAAPFLPRDLVVEGVLLDDTTGALETVIAPGDAVPIGASLPASPAGEAQEREKASPAQPSPPTAGAHPPAWGPSPATVARTPPAGAGEAARAGDAAAAGQALQAARSFVSTLASKAGWRERVRGLQAELNRQTNPLAQLGVLDHFIRAAAADSREIADGFNRLRREAIAAGRHLSEEELLDLLRRAIMEERP